MGETVKMQRDNFTLFLVFLSVVISAILFLPVINLLATTSIGQYISAFLDEEVRLAIFLSLFTATLTTILAIVLGVPLAYILARKDFPFKETIDSLVDLPILIPHTVAGIALLTLFGPRAIIGSALRNFGLIFTSTIYGIVLAQFFVSAPLLIKTTKEILLKIDERVIKVARTLGASPRDVFFDIELPLSAKGILTGAILCWARAISEFGAVIILAYYPHTAPVLIYVRFETWGLSASKPISALLLIVTLSIFILLKYIEKKSD